MTIVRSMSVDVSLQLEYLSLYFALPLPLTWSVAVRPSPPNGAVYQYPEGLATARGTTERT